MAWILVWTTIVSYRLSVDTYGVFPVMLMIAAGYLALKMETRKGKVLILLLPALFKN